MRNGKYDVLSPLYSGEPVNEAEVLGAAVWLWMHSPLHRDAPLHTLPDLLLPVIKHRQYVITTEQGRPVFFMSWAWLSQEAEARYLTQPAILMPQSDWNSGDRMWVCDWVAPFGHTPDMSRLVRQDIFPRQCWRSLYHRGHETGLRVMNFRGAQVSREEVRQWRVQYPLAVDVPER
ncbi:TPA: toxin-activating lysine-acyltransferase [Escherichia coli]|nr:toxin-activating lysine-acyltransferase [Escherichia coli]HAW2239315.1 toxin-activating lysine-acyltransferase [Escherichia coli]